MLVWYLELKGPETSDLCKDTVSQTLLTIF